MSEYLPGTKVQARGLNWVVLESQSLGVETRLRLRGEGIFAGHEIDLLTPFETVNPTIHKFDPEHGGPLPNWIVYHQAFLLEQALGPDAFLAVQPGRLRIEPYQLVPLARVLRMSRPRMLLADDVGLGKTIEAGLVIAELMARRRVHRLLIVTPAGPLLEQWQAEMLERFGLRLEIADRANLDRIRRATELGANPFDHLPLALASMDFLKQDRVLDELERALPYDMVIMDEAHHYAESGTNEADRIDASQRRRLGQVLAQKSDALLLLTATPHDGYDRSFASLLELLDPSLVDAQGKPRADAYVSHIVRRLKKHVRVTHPETGELVSFPERELVPIPVSSDSLLLDDFVALHRGLLEFVAPALKRALRARQYDDALAYLTLLKRSTSTVQALRKTIVAVRTRLEELGQTKQEEVEARKQRRQSIKTLQRKLARFGTLTLDEETEREELEQEELAQQLALLDRENRQTRAQTGRIESAVTTLRELEQLANAAIERDLKLSQLVNEIRAIREQEPTANILIYTEYVDSLRAVEKRLNDLHLGPVLTIHGSVHDEENGESRNRRIVTGRFGLQDGLILVSTDAAAEGLNLHARCHHLIHLELPWNPNRLEQRNGRIDRYGQWKTPIVRYLYLCGTFEERILARLVAKFERQRERLKFVPNTLGVDLDALPQEGLFAALVQDETTFGKPCRGFHSIQEGDTSADPDVQALLEEVEASLGHFERAAKTHRWLGDEGSAADALAQQTAQRALAIGQKLGNVDLVEFVRHAVQIAGGGVQVKPHWIDFTLPSDWRFGLENLPGWNGTRLRVTTELNRTTDDQDESVGYLGRAHPLVRRAIEHVQYLALGQSNGLDERVSAARSPNGKPALLFTFLGHVASQAEREFERLLAVRVTQDFETEVLTQDSNWLPASADGISPKNLWAREFQSWGEQAETTARAAALVAFEELAAQFLVRHHQQLTEERRQLDKWFEERVRKLIELKAIESLPLFEQTAVQNISTEQRLDEFIAMLPRSSKERAQAESILRMHRERVVRVQQHETIQSQDITVVGILMFSPTE